MSSHPRPGLSREWIQALPLRLLAIDSLLAIGVVALVSVVIAVVNLAGQVSNISNLYVIGTAALAARRGRYAAILASILSFLAYDWIFIPPVGTFTVSNPSEYVGLITLLVTSVLIGQLLVRVRQRAAEARQQQTRTSLLYDVSEAALSNANGLAVYPLALRRLSETLGFGWSRFFMRGDAGFAEVATYGTPLDNPERQYLFRRVDEAAQPLGIWRQRANNVRIISDLDIGAGQTRSPEGGELEEIYLPVSLNAQVEGILIVGARTDGEPPTPADARFLLAFANQLASAVQRDHLEDQRGRARALEESDRLKSALVSSVSHELKTPLTTIKASATGLMQDETTRPDSVARELAESIDRETDRLTRLVSNLLDMSRLEAGALQPRLERVSIADVIADVLDRMEPVLGRHQITVDLSESVRETALDFVLISQVLTNLLDNAMRYSPPDAGITVSAEVVRAQLRVTVFNEGSYIPPADLERLFDKFYRLSTISGGTGLGLAIARGIVEAHHGHIWAENVGRRGVSFSFTLPAPLAEPESLAEPIATPTIGPATGGGR